MLCKDAVGIFNSMCEKHNFLCSLKKVKREQKPNLKMVVPFVKVRIKNHYALNLKKHLLCFGETEIQSVCLLLVCSALCISLCACLCKLLLCLVLVLWEMSCAWYQERVENLCDMVLVFSSRGDHWAVISVVCSEMHGVSVVWIRKLNLKLCTPVNCCCIWLEAAGYILLNWEFT